MKNLLFVFSFNFLFFSNSFAQQEQTYYDLVNQAWKLYEAKDYLKSAQTYSKAFTDMGKGLVPDRYNAACSWALANNKDSSFSQLFKITQKGTYSDVDHLTTDTDLEILHSDKRWKDVVASATANKEKELAKMDKPLAAKLDSIYKEDQYYRLQLDTISKKYGWKSKQINDQWKIINEKDSTNLLAIKNILDNRGWLGADKIGKQGNQTLFLVVQHADKTTQEKYLPMMREAVKAGNAQADNLALLEDRVAMKQGKKQIYGSQVGQDSTRKYFVFPLLDPDNVDKRRAEVGLPPLADYLSYWNMTWNVEDYKRNLPIYEKLQKKMYSE